MRQEALAKLVAEVAKGSLEITAESLVELLEIDAHGILGKIDLLRNTLAMYQIEILPDLNSGELTTTRLLRFEKRTEGIDANEIRACIEMGESGEREFKVTLLFHTKKHDNEPGLECRAYRSEEVLHACLRTIAAYLNSGGGVLLVGVSDDGVVCGIERDYCFAETENRDKWELHLRNCIRGKFKDGASINDYVKVVITEIDSKTVAYIRITKRGRLSVLRDFKGQNHIYRRQGNQTTVVDAADIEEFIEERRRPRA